MIVAIKRIAPLSPNATCAINLVNTDAHNKILTIKTKGSIACLVSIHFNTVQTSCYYSCIVTKLNIFLIN